MLPKDSDSFFKCDEKPPAELSVLGRSPVRRSNSDAGGLLLLFALSCDVLVRVRRRSWRENYFFKILVWRNRTFIVGRVDSFSLKANVATDSCTRSRLSGHLRLDSCCALNRRSLLAFGRTAVILGSRFRWQVAGDSKKFDLRTTSRGRCPDVFADPAQGPAPATFGILLIGLLPSAGVLSKKNPLHSFR